LVRARR
jgi:hypothetical protein